MWNPPPSSILSFPLYIWRNLVSCHHPPSSTTCPHPAGRWNPCRAARVRSNPGPLAPVLRRAGAGECSWAVPEGGAEGSSGGEGADSVRRRRRRGALEGDAGERESGDGKWTLRSVKRKKNNCDVWVPDLIVGIE